MSLLRASGRGVARTDPRYTGQGLCGFMINRSQAPVGVAVPVQCITQHLDVLTYRVNFLPNEPRPSRRTPVLWNAHLTRLVAVLTHPVAANPKGKAKLSDLHFFFPFFEPFAAAAF